MERHSIGRGKAIALAESHWWELCDDREIAMTQLFTAELCMPFDRFHQSVEKALGRSVWTHEFGLNYDGLCRELLGETEPPTMQQIIDMIPAETRIIVSVDSE